MNTILNVLSAGLVIGLWADPGITNPDVCEGVKAGLNSIPWGIGLICLLDAANSSWKALRS